MRLKHLPLFSRLAPRATVLLCCLLLSPDAPAAVSLLNVSYDMSREFYAEYNSLFARFWATNQQERIKIHQSHGGSTKQARALLEGLPGDVVTINQPADLDVVASAGLLTKDWRERFPNRAVPYFSTIAFLVRGPNPKQIRDWDDLAVAGVGIVVTNPKTSGNGRYAYLAALAYGQQRYQTNQSLVEDFLHRLYANVPVLDSGGRAATTTFVQRQVGDVLITFEAEAMQTLREHPGEFELVRPSLTIEVSAPVAVVDEVVNRRKTRRQAEAYLRFLYGEPAQELVARHFYRPTHPEVARRHAHEFPALEVVTVEEAFGSWSEVYKRHFVEGAAFDRIMAVPD